MTFSLALAGWLLTGFLVLIVLRLSWVSQMFTPIMYQNLKKMTWMFHFFPNPRSRGNSHPGPSMDNRSMGQGRDFTLILTDKCITVQPLYNGHVETQTMQTADRADCADWVLFFYLYINFLVSLTIVSCFLSLCALCITTICALMCTCKGHQ